MNSAKSGRTQEHFCDEFLASHSEYLDGLLPPLKAARMSAHAMECAPCSRYDRIMRRGLLLVRDLPEIEASGDFETRLQHRLLHLESVAAGGARTRTAGVAATLGVAAALALLAWSPVLVQSSDSARMAASLEALDAEPVHAGFGAGSLLVESGWYPVSLPSAPAHQATAALVMFPGPHSPLVVTPPAHRSMRRVSTEHRPID